MRSARNWFAVLAVIAFTASADPSATTDADAQRVRQTISGLPIVFERNEGQYPQRFDFGSRVHGQSFMVRGSGAEIAVRPDGKNSVDIGVTFVGAQTDPVLQPSDEAVTRTNYIRGNDPSKWLIGVPTYSEVRYGGIYPGVDVVYHGTQRQLEYDFVVSPGADPRQIRVRFDGVAGVDLESGGDLRLRTATGTIVHRRPVAYQNCGNERRDVPVSYRLSAKNEVTFTLGQYDRDVELVIDPMIVFSTFFGGLADEAVSSIATDPSGNIYMVGKTAGSPFLATAGAFQLTSRDLPDQDGVHETLYDGFVTKIAPNGSPVLFTTYIGGLSNDIVHGVAIDGLGRAVIGGETQSRDFPTTPGAFRASLPNGFGDYAHSTSHGFVAKLQSTGGGLIYSTYLGADTFYTDERVIGVATDNVGNAWVTGETGSDNFPVTPGAYQQEFTRIGSFPIPDGFVAKFNPTGGLVYSTYLGDESWDRPDSIAVDGSGNAYIRTRTYSPLFRPKRFPVTPGAYQPSGDYFVTKLDASGSNIIYSTGLGGDTNRRVDIEEIHTGGIAVDSSGSAYVTGYTEDTFPTTPGAFLTTGCPSLNGFVTKLSPNGTTAMYSSYINGTECRPTWAYGIAVSSSGEAYVTGTTLSFGFPTVNGVQEDTLPECKHCLTASRDAYVTKFTSAGTLGDFSTTYGGLGDDEGFAVTLYGGLVVFAGMHLSGADLWSVAPSSNAPDRQQGNVFLAKINPLGATPASPAILSIAPIVPANSGIEPMTIRGIGFVDGANVTIGGLPPHGGTDVISDTLIRFTATERPPGTYEIVVTNPNGAIAKKMGARFMTFPTLVACAFNAPPISPREGPHTGGTPIIIRGTGFQGGAVVTVGSTVASNIQVINSTEIHAVMPPGRPIQSDVIVINPDGTFTSTINRCGWFEYLGSAPVVTSVTPSTLRAFAEQPITVEGSNFLGSTIPTYSDVRVVDTGTITATTPFLAPGTYGVTVQNEGGPGTSDTLEYALNVIPEPSVSPSYGPSSGGTAITIKGHGFQPGARVFFSDGEEATNVVVPDDETIQANTPVQDFFVNGNLRPVTVINPNSQTFTILKGFQYISDNGSVTITGVSPNSGFTTGGETVTVSGTGFGTSPGSMDVLIGGFSATDVVFVDSNTITLKTPQHVPGPVDVAVAFVNGAGAVLQGGFTYVAGPPMITGITPTKGIPGGGTDVTIFGKGFAPGATVTFGGNPMTNVQVRGAGVIQGRTPAHAIGPVDVVVTNTDSQSGTLPNGFTYGFPGLSLTPVAPTIMPGTQQTMTVTLDAAQATDTVVTLTAANPSLLTMPSSVTVTANTLQKTFVITAGTTPGATTVTAKLPPSMGSVESVANITIPDAPIVNSFNPTSGDGGTVVSIHGTKFSGATAVTFGGANAASFTVVNATEITATTAANGTTGPICVTVPGPLTGCSTTPFTFPPRVTGFSPSSALPGTTVTINGVNFQDATSVAFNGVQSNVFEVNEAGTSLTAEVPAGATTGPVSVTTPAGTGTSSTSFGVPPAITGFSPTRGGPGGSVTINGVRFTGATAVAFNGTPAASFNVTNDGVITAVLPAAATSGPISVTTPGGTGTSADSFTVVSTAAITSFSPTSGPPGTVVTIIGSNFTDASAVKFNGTNAASFTVQDDTTVIATVPSAATNGTISITTPEGTGFSTTMFHLPPVLSSFAPSAAARGADVIISGNNFLGATSVKFNGVPATFTVNAQDKITATVPVTATSGQIVVTTPYGPATSTFPFTVLTETTPTVVATATSATSVTLNWEGVAGHTFEIRRILHKNQSFAANPIATVTGTSYVDNGVTGGKTYLYSLLDTTTGEISNNEYATTIMFTDDPIESSDRVRSVHLTQLRSAVNAMRVAAALPTMTFTDPAPAGLIIRRVHVNELRQGLTEALLQLGRHITFTDATLSTATLVRAAHFSEIRTAVK